MWLLITPDSKPKKKTLKTLWFPNSATLSVGIRSVGCSAKYIFLLTVLVNVLSDWQRKVVSLRWLTAKPCKHIVCQTPTTPTVLWVLHSLSVCVWLYIYVIALTANTVHRMGVLHWLCGCICFYSKHAHMHSNLPVCNNTRPKPISQSPWDWASESN